jgi:isopentenyl-diphosphate delta-isomerase
MKKLLWPGKWDVSVTSHVHKNENYEEAGIRRTRQELNASVENLNRLFSFTYFAPYGEYSENEFCVFLEGELDDTVRPNHDEIMEIKYTTVGQLATDIQKDPESYTPWLKIAFEKYQHRPPRTK